MNSDSQRQTRVLLEQIRSEVKIVSEQHGSIMRKLQEHDQKFINIEVRFDRVDVRLSRVEGRFDGVEGRFDGVEGRLDRIEKVITGVMSDHETRIKKVEDKLIAA